MKSVTGVRAVPHLQGRRIDLTWQNPPASAFDGGLSLAGTRIVRRERTFPRSPEDGEIVYDGPVASQFADRGLEPLTTYYYTIFAVDSAVSPDYYADDNSQAAALATENYNLTERLYRLLPAVHQRYDTPLGTAELAQLAPAVVSALNASPSELRSQGQLRRFLYAAAAPLDLMRSLAEGLRQLHDVDLARPEFLLSLAHWIGWELDRTLPVFAQRNEIKFAPHLYRNVGTVPNLRAIVQRYTGWYTQVAEFAQHIARSNMPPQLNVFAVTEEAGLWRGTDDAAPVLGFGAGSNEATGSGSLPAILVSTASEPFALRPGMEFAITADNRIPVVVRFRPGDFADMGNATADEVAAVLNHTLSEVTATPLPGGQVELRSHTVGPDSSLRVEQYAARLVTLEGAPRGRLSTFVDGDARVRLFYETADPLAPAMAQAAAQALRGESFPTGLVPGENGSRVTGGAGTSPTRLPSQPQGRVRYKTFRNGAWGKSHPLTEGTDVAEGDPAAVELLDGRIWVAWIENPNTDSARLRFKVGNVRSPQPARLVGQRSEPFAITPDTHLLLRGNWPEAEGFEFAATDFANPQNGTAAEAVTALNARLSRVIASVQPNGTLLLETLAVGGDERLEIDLGHFSAAQALGFGSENAMATGEWGEAIDWSAPQDVTPAAPGRHADLHAVVNTAGTVWLFWATHDAANWRIVTTRWDGTTWSPLEIVADGLGGNREPCAVLDATDRIWLFWARREGVGGLEDTWTLRRRVYHPTTGTWDTEAALTTPPSGGRAADREPGAAHLSSGDLRVFFRSDRAGGPDLWSVTVTPSTGVMSALAAVAAAPSAAHAPAPVLMPGGALWLLYRSDRSVPLSRVATRPLPAVENRVTSPAPVVKDPPPGRLRSLRMSDTGTLHRFAGTTSVVLDDAARIGRRRQWDDLLSYTPQKPLGTELLQDDDLYTRGTVGLYVSQLIPDSPLSQQKVERLRAVLERFLPINVRAVVILAPRVYIEYIYRPDADIEEAYLDKHPDIEYYTGLGDSTAAALPDWVLLLSTTPGHVSADPADLTTLRRRTYFPPPS